MTVPGDKSEGRKVKAALPFNLLMGYKKNEKRRCDNGSDLPC